MTTETAHDSPSSEVTRCWDRCRSEEERILKTDLQVLQDKFKDSLTFGPLLSSDSNSSSDRLMADNYRQLVRMLRNADSLEEKLRLLAMWLRQERILQPREFLSKKIRKTIIESTLRAFEKPKRKKHSGPEHAEITAPVPSSKTMPKPKRLAARPSELRYALAAEAWKPYFEMMHSEYERLPIRRQTKPVDRLTQFGFQSTAVNAALGATKILRSPIQAACRFAASHLKVDEDTVLAAHSKLYPTRHRSD
jgi:hypothetical protein